MTDTGKGVVYDVVFIGGGISTLYTLLGMVEALEAEGSTAASIKVAVIDKVGDFGRGLPYGSSVSEGLLLLPAQYMLPAVEDNAFISFLKTRKDKWLPCVSGSSAPGITYWHQKNETKILHEDFSDVYFPRSVFGLFLAELRDELRLKIQRNRKISLSCIKDELASVERQNGRFFCRSEKNVYIATSIVLAVGSPLRTLSYGNSSFESMYDVPLAERRSTLKNHLAQSESGNKNILVVGSNAAALDAVYMLGTDAALISMIDNIDVVSKSGILPEVMTGKKPAFSPLNVLSLKDSQTKTADALWNAIVSDHVDAKEHGYSSYDIAPVLRQAVKDTLKTFSTVEEQRFVDIYSLQLLRLTRSSGPEYRTVFDGLLSGEKLRILSATVCHVEACASGHVFEFEGEVDHSSIKRTYAAVLNCSGPAYLDESRDKLIRNLLDKGLVSANSSRRGIVSDTDFQAGDNIYIVGPLLAGNTIDGNVIWHLESSWRISELAPKLGQKLTEKLLRNEN